MCLTEAINGGQVYGITTEGTYYVRILHNVKYGTIKNWINIVTTFRLLAEQPDKIS